MDYTMLKMFTNFIQIILLTLFQMDNLVRALDSIEVVSKGSPKKAITCDKREAFPAAHSVWIIYSNSQTQTPTCHCFLHSSSTKKPDTLSLSGKRYVSDGSMKSIYDFPTNFWKYTKSNYLYLAISSDKLEIHESMKNLPVEEKSSSYKVFGLKMEKNSPFGLFCSPKHETAWILLEVQKPYIIAVVLLGVIALVLLIIDIVLYKLLTFQKARLTLTTEEEALLSKKVSEWRYSDSSYASADSEEGEAPPTPEPAEEDTSDLNKTATNEVSKTTDMTDAITKLPITDSVIDANDVGKTNEPITEADGVPSTNEPINEAGDNVVKSRSESINADQNLAKTNDEPRTYEFSPLERPNSAVCDTYL